MIDSHDLDRLEEQAVAEALRADCEALTSRIELPAAGLVWWRATIRARAEAARTVERPIAAAQAVAAACLIALAVGALAFTWHTIPDLVVQHAMLAVVAVAICLLVAPVAILVALAE